MEESISRGALSNSNGGFNVGTLGRQPGTILAPKPSAEFLFYCPFATFAPLEGWILPSLDVSFPAFLFVFLFFSRGSTGETQDGRKVGVQGLTATSGVVAPTWDSNKASRLVFFLCSTIASGMSVFFLITSYLNNRLTSRIGTQGFHKLELVKHAEVLF